MNYILKQFDEPLVKFSATTDTSEPEIQILWTNEEKAALLPLDLTLTPDGLSRRASETFPAEGHCNPQTSAHAACPRHRSAPADRAYNQTHRRLSKSCCPWVWGA